MNTFNSKIPTGALHEKWDNYKADAKLVNPNNKRKFKIIVVGTISVAAFLSCVHTFIAPNIDFLLSFQRLLQLVVHENQNR